MTGLGVWDVVRIDFLIAYRGRRDDAVALYQRCGRLFIVGAGAGLRLAERSFQPEANSGPKNENEKLSTNPNAALATSLSIRCLPLPLFHNQSPSTRFPRRTSLLKKRH
jgi:hypothetical protein